MRQGRQEHGAKSIHLPRRINRDQFASALEKAGFRPGVSYATSFIHLAAYGESIQLCQVWQTMRQVGLRCNVWEITLRWISDCR